jgi:hypothetical protein
MFMPDINSLESVFMCRIALFLPIMHIIQVEESCLKISTSNAYYTLNLRYVASKDQLTDLGTKSYPCPQFQRMRPQLYGEEQLVWADS